MNFRVIQFVHLVFTGGWAQAAPSEGSIAYTAGAGDTLQVYETFWVEPQVYTLNAGDVVYVNGTAVHIPVP